MERLAKILLPAVLLAITVSPTIAGQCARAAIIVPVYWFGQFYGWPALTFDTALRCVQWSLF